VCANTIELASFRKLELIKIWFIKNYFKEEVFQTTYKHYPLTPEELVCMLFLLFLFCFVILMGYMYIPWKSQQLCCPSFHQLMASLNLQQDFHKNMTFKLLIRPSRLRNKNSISIPTFYQTSTEHSIQNTLWRLWLELRGWN